MKTPFFPHSRVRERPREAALSLKEPLGFWPSNLHQRFSEPIDLPYLLASTKGVQPSERVTMFSSDRGGIRSLNCQIESLTRIAEAKSQPARSYLASSTAPHFLQRECVRTGYVDLHVMHSSRRKRFFFLLPSPPVIFRCVCICRVYSLYLFFPILHQTSKI